MRTLLLVSLAGTFLGSGCSSSSGRSGSGATWSSPPRVPSSSPLEAAPVTAAPVVGSAPMPPPPLVRPDTVATMPSHAGSPRNGGSAPSRPSRRGDPSRAARGANGHGTSVVSDDTIQVRGDTLLTEGVVYDFSLELAKKLPLAARPAAEAPVIAREAVPAFGDSARACLQGEGFTIVLSGEPSGVTCSVKPLADQAQRRWVWNVRPDTVSRVHGARRELLFSVKSYGNNTREDFVRSLPVTVLIVPPTWFERVMTVATSTKGLLAELVAIAAAIAALVKYVRRKRAEDAGQPLN